jgi:hypothetical protein
MQDHIAMNGHEYRPDKQRNDAAESLGRKAPNSSKRLDLHSSHAHVYKERSWKTAPKLPLSPMFAPRPVPDCRANRFHATGRWHPATIVCGSMCARLGNH